MLAWGLVYCVKFSTPHLALDSSKYFATSLLNIDPLIFFLDLWRASLLEVCIEFKLRIIWCTST